VLGLTEGNIRQIKQFQAPTTVKETRAGLVSDSDSDSDDLGAVK
jgi:hypothetical protein